MRCGRVRRWVVEADAGVRPAAIEDHLGACPKCAAYARDWDRLQAGLQRVAEEPVPAPSLGFVPRVLRRLEAAGAEERAGELFFERVGQRFVYAALLTALLLLMGLLLPSSGPWRTPSTAAIYLTQPEAVAARNYPIFPGQSLDTDYQFVAPQSGGR